MKEIIDRVLETDGPVLCNIIMSSELNIQPRVVSKILENGMMESGKLEDLFPFLSIEELQKNLNLDIEE